MSPARSPLSLPTSLRAIVVFSCLLSQVPLAQSTICYDITGLQNEKYYPCESDAKVSSCCSPGDVCLSNGLCAPSPASKASHPDGFYVTPFYWNGCSDPTFKDPKCFSACFSVSGNGVKNCPEAGPGAYCCYGFSGCDCSNPDDVVTVSVATILTTIDPGITSVSSTTSSTHTSLSTSTPHTTSSVSSTEDSSSESVPSTKDSSSASSTTASPSASSTSDSSSASSTSDSSSASASSTKDSSSASSTHASSSTSTTQDSAAAAQPETSTSTDTPQADEGKSSAVPIGVGVGVGGAVLIAVAAAVFFFLRRRRQQAPYLGPPYLGPQVKYEEVSPDGTQYEMAAGYNAAELSSVIPPQELPAPSSRKFGWMHRD